MKKTVRSILFNKATLLGIAMFAITAGTLVGVNLNKKVVANDCSSNAIMTCGTSSAKDFISKTKAKKNPDLQTIYSSYGLAPADYSRFVTSARPGLAYKDGRIVVDGRTVATSAESIGRSHFSFAHAKNIGGKTYWESRSQDVFLSNTIPVMVLFNAKGQMEFAVMYDCGNPTNGNPNNPTYSCNNLSSKQVDRDTYQFATSASAGNGASINHVVYDFGDGHTQSEASASKVVTHNYAKPGTYTTKVTVYVNVPGSQTYAIIAAGSCVKKVTVAPVPPTPVAACKALTAIVSDRTSVRLNATATVSGGATISGYNFSVKDASGKVIASPVVKSTAASAATTLTVQTPGTYSAEVTVTTSVGTKTSPYCKTNFTIANNPVAACIELTVAAIDRTNYKLSASATATGGATISGYDFVVKNAAGNVVTTKTVTGSSSTATTNVTVTETGAYAAQATVHTSLGDMTGPQCTASFNVPPAPVPGVSITKHVDGTKLEQVAVNQSFVYQLVVTNNGKVNLTNAVVTDPAPQGVTMLSADLGTVANNSWSYTIPSLKIGESKSFNITAKVVTYLPGNIVNTACVNAPEVNPGNPTQEDDCDTATVTVTPPTPKNPNITITKTVDGVKLKQVGLNQNFVYQLVITNKGEIDLTNVAVTDPAPQGVTMLSADLGTVADNNWSYTIPSLKVGASVTVNITADITEYLPGNIVNTACVNAPEVNPSQPNENDACDTATVTVTPPTVTPPTELPNTGAGAVISLFAGVSILGTLGYRLLLARKLSRS